MAVNLRKIGVRDVPPPDRLARIMDGYVRRGLRATVSTSGVTGLSRIELNILENPPPPAELSWKPRHPLIPPAPSLMESLSDAATRVMNQINKMNFSPVWSNLQNAAESAARLTERLAALVDTQGPKVDSILQSADGAAARLDELVHRLGDNPSLLLRPADPEPLPETK